MMAAKADNTLTHPPGQNGRHLLKFVPKGLIDNNPVLV